MSSEPLTHAPASAGLIRVCRLAEGGMARVDLAIKRVGTFRRMYAVKRLHPHLASDPEFRAMFVDEARIAGLIRHPNVVGVQDVGEDELGPFLVMDYVDGLPLANLSNRARAGGEPMPVQIAVRIALDIARGLHAAHETRIDERTTGVVHRDLSPQNVLVGFDGQARLTDFGIAKARGYGTRTATGMVKGKTSYLAPEQIRFEEPDRRTDLFSFGIVLFEMLSGERLYKRGDGSSDMHAIIEEPVPDIGELRNDVPDELVRLLFELLAKSREQRPKDAQEVVRRLETILAELINQSQPLDVAEYVGLIAGDSKREQDRVLAEAMAEAERVGERRDAALPLSAFAETAAPDIRLTPAPIAHAPGPSRRVVWSGLALALAAVLAIAFLVRPPPPLQQPAPPPVVEAPVVEAPVVEAPVVEAPPPTTVAEPEPAPPRRRRVKAVRKNKKAPNADQKPLPDWVEFER